MKTVRQSKEASGNPFSWQFSGSPRRVKILDFQGLTLGHPAQDIWTIVYASTDPDYRAASLEADLRAYYAVLATYMEAAPAFEEFMQEVEERWVYGMVLFSELFIFSGVLGITFFWWPIPKIGDISPVQRYYLQFSDISISITVHPYRIPISGIE